MQYFTKFLLWLFGWKVIGSVIPVPKCIVLGVPHTSLWDFVISWIFYKSVGGTPNILVNKKYFFFSVCFLCSAHFLLELCILLVFLKFGRSYPDFSGNKKIFFLSGWFFAKTYGCN